MKKIYFKAPPLLAPATHDQASRAMGNFCSDVAGGKSAIGSTNSSLAANAPNEAADAFFKSRGYNGLLSQIEASPAMGNFCSDVASGKSAVGGTNSSLEANAPNEAADAFFKSRGHNGLLSQIEYTPIPTGGGCLLSGGGRGLFPKVLHGTTLGERYIIGKAASHSLCSISQSTLAPAPPFRFTSSHSFHLRPSARPIPDLSLHDKEFQFNPYADKLYDLVTGLFGSRIIIASYRWPMSASGPLITLENLRLLGDTCYYHGTWPEGHWIIDPRLLDQRTFDELYGDFDYVYDHYEAEVHKYWRCFRGHSNKEWILDEWYKHGLPYAIPADMYLHNGLALRACMPDSFGLPVNTKVLTGDVSPMVNLMLHNLELFGEKLRDQQARVYPQLKIIKDPYSLVSSPVIFEMRLPLKIEVVNGEARYKAVGVVLPNIFKTDLSTQFGDIILPSVLSGTV